MCGGVYIGVLLGCCLFFFFFKQKTAYEIGTGDWSSDVCSSDLHKIFSSMVIRIVSRYTVQTFKNVVNTLGLRYEVEIGRASCRERV